MNEQIRERIDAELPPGGIPVGLDVDTVMRSSRSRRTRVRLVGGGAVLASVAVVAALVLSVMTLAPSGGADDAASPNGPVKDDPVLDPDKDFHWDGAFPAKKTDVAKAYTKAYWEYMLTEHPEATFAKTNLLGDEHTPTEGDQSAYAHFMEGEDRLMKGSREDRPNSDQNPVRQRTVLNLYERDEPGEGSENTTCCMLNYEFDGDDGDPDGIELAVYPKGTYTKRTGDAMDLTTNDGPYDTRIDDVVGPDGEDIQYVTDSTQANSADFENEAEDFRWFVVVYRADGSAVVVKLNSGGDDATEPNLSFTELQGIALALPETSFG